MERKSGEKGNFNKENSSRNCSFMLSMNFKFMTIIANLHHWHHCLSLAVPASETETLLSNSSAMWKVKTEFSQCSGYKIPMQLNIFEYTL